MECYHIFFIGTVTAMSLISVDILVYAQQEVVTVPSSQTHGDILFIGAKDILSGISEYSKNIQFNDVKTEECYNRIPVEGDFYGPHFTLQNMSCDPINDPINEDIYSYVSYEDLVFWAEQPDEVFELNVDLTIPVKPEGSAPGLDV